jgi:hypothetical protein
MPGIVEILKISLIAFMFSALIQQRQSVFTFYRKLIKRLPWYLYKPLGGCYICFTGQFCLWYFIFTKPLDIFELLFFCSAGILTSMIYHKIYCYLK